MVIVMVACVAERSCLLSFGFFPPEHRVIKVISPRSGERSRHERAKPARTRHERSDTTGADKKANWSACCAGYSNGESLLTLPKRGFSVTTTASLVRVWKKYAPNTFLKTKRTGYLRNHVPCAVNALEV